MKGMDGKWTERWREGSGVSWALGLGTEWCHAQRKEAVHKECSGDTLNLKCQNESLGDDSVGENAYLISMA